MNNISHYKKIVAFLCLLVVLVLISYYFLYGLLVSKNLNSANLLDYMTTESSREVSNFTTQKQLQTLDADIKRVRSSIVSSSDVVSFIEKLEGIAHDNGLQINNDSILEENDPNVSSSTVVFLKIRSTTSGSWAGTYKFLSDLEALPYKVRVDSFNMSSSVAGNNDVLLGKNNQARSSLDKVWDTNFEIRVLKYK